MYDPPRFCKSEVGGGIVCENVSGLFVELSSWPQWISARTIPHNHDRRRGPSKLPTLPPRNRYMRMGHTSIQPPRQGREKHAHIKVLSTRKVRTDNGASPEELTPLLPETLPEDFGEWDKEASPEPSPIKTGEWEPWEAAHSFGGTKSPRGQSADRGPIAAPPEERPHGSGSTPSAPVFVAQQKHFVEWDGETSPTPKPVDLSEWEAWEAAHSFGKSPNPAKQSADRETSPSPVVERPRVSSPVPSTPFPAKQ
jgi:hypothetical protein